MSGISGKKRKKRKGMIAAISAVPLVLIVLAWLMADMFRGSPKMRLMRGFRHLTQKTMQAPGFLLSDISLTELIKSVGGDATGSGQIRLSGIQGLDVMLALDYQAERMTSVGQGRMAVSLRVLRFPVGDMTVYAEGDTLYVDTPFLGEMVALKCGANLFPALAYPAVEMDAAWERQQREELRELAREITVTQTEEGAYGVDAAETERFLVEVSETGMRKLFVLLGMDGAAEPFSFYVDLTKDDRICGITARLPDSLGSDVVCRLEGDVLGKLTVARDTTQGRNWEIVLERADEGERIISVDANWGVPEQARRYALVGDISWEEREGGYRLEMEKFIVKDGADILVRVDADGDIIPSAAASGRLFEEESVAQAREWDLAGLRRALSEAVEEAGALLQGLQRFW